MSTRVGRYPASSSMNVGQCVVDTDGFFELGLTDEGTVGGIITSLGEVIKNGLVQIELQGYHPAVAYENCWVDKHGYIFSRGDEDPPLVDLEPSEPIPEPEPEPEEPEPEVPVLRPFPINPYIDLWEAERYSITLKVSGVGTVLSGKGKDWLVVTNDGVKFDNIFIPCIDPIRITIEKRNHQTALIVNGFRAVEHGQKIYIDRIGMCKYRESFEGIVQDIELIDLNNSNNNRFYSMRPEMMEYIPTYTVLSEEPEVVEVVEEEVEEVEEPRIIRLPEEPVLVTNLQFVTGGMNPWVQLNEVHHG